MVKIVALFCVLSTNFLANAQVDTIKCEESFTLIRYFIRRKSNCYMGNSSLIERMFSKGCR